MLAAPEPDHVHLSWWSSFVLGYGFGLGFVFAQMSLTVVAGVILLVIVALTR